MGIPGDIQALQGAATPSRIARFLDAGTSEIASPGNIVGRIDNIAARIAARKSEFGIGRGAIWLRLVALNATVHLPLAVPGRQNRLWNLLQPRALSVLRSTQRGVPDQITRTSDNEVPIMIR